MMNDIKIIDNHEIDRTKWDNLLLANPNAFPYSISWYLDLVSPNWKALIVGDYNYALALPFRKKWGISYVFPPEFTQQMGVFGREIPSDELVTEIISVVSGHFPFIEMNLNHDNELKRSLKSLKKKWRKNYELDLSLDYEALYSHFHKNTQRNIKKTKAEKLSLIEVDDASLMINAFKNFKAKRLKGKELSYMLLENIIDEGMARKSISLYDIKSEDTYLGSALFLTIANRKIFLFSAINDQGRKKRAMFFLLNSMIEKYAKQNLILDFEGSDEPKLASFYQRFGAKEKLYLHIKINRLPLAIKWLKK